MKNNKIIQTTCGAWTRKNEYDTWVWTETLGKVEDFRVSLKNREIENGCVWIKEYYYDGTISESVDLMEVKQ